MNFLSADITKIYTSHQTPNTEIEEIIPQFTYHCKCNPHHLLNFTSMKQQQSILNKKKNLIANKLRQDCNMINSIDSIQQLYKKQIDDLKQDLNHCAQQLNKAMNLLKVQKQINHKLRTRLQNVEQKQQCMINQYKNKIKKEFQKSIEQVLIKKERQINAIKSNAQQKQKQWKRQNQQLKTNIQHLKSQLNQIQKSFENYTNGGVKDINNYLHNFTL